MKSLRVLTPALAAACVLPLAGCAALTDSSATGAGDSSRTIATGLYPLQYVAARVAGDAFDVENLTAPGGEPHDLELGVGQTAEVADAALVVLDGSLQPAVNEAAAETGSGRVLDAASVVGLLPFDGEHADHEGEATDEDDPHFWQDPLRMAALGDAVAAELAGIDPDDAASFTDNAADLRRDLEALDVEYAAGLAHCAVTTVVTNHEAFGYLAKYGLHLESIAGISPDAEPTPAALADLQDLIEQDGITTVFSESLVSPKTAQTLARDAGVDTAVLDTLEGLSEATADEDYLSLMHRNLAALEEANGC